MTEPRREELIEALEPFADEADYLWNKERPDHSDVAAGPTVRLKIKVRDLNRAREVYRALTRAGGKGEACQACNGSGKTPMATIAIALPPAERRALDQSAADNPVDCWRCNGTGKAITAPSQPASGPTKSTCPYCRGTIITESAPATDEGKVEPVKHEDRIERLDKLFYIRWTSGPDYERAYICIDDGEPDMCDVAETNFKRARLFAEAYRAMHPPARPAPAVDRVALIKLADQLRQSARQSLRGHSPALIAQAVPYQLEWRAADAILSLLPAQTSSDEGGKDAELVRELREEAMRLSGRSLDRGCVNSGIASNLADRAADRLEALSAGEK